MTGEEKFILDGKDLSFDYLDFWQFQYSNVYNLQEYIAEFLVAKALGLQESCNTEYWTLYDVLYRNTRIEVKQTSYYNPWNEGGKVSQQRTLALRRHIAVMNRMMEKTNLKGRMTYTYFVCLTVIQKKLHIR